MNLQLYELIQSAYELVSQLDGKPVNSLALLTSDDYSGNKTLEIEVRISIKSQNLEGIAITLHEKNPNEAFTQEEIANLSEFVRNPSRLSVSGILKGEIYYSVTGESFDLTIEKGRLIKTIEWKSRAPILDEDDIIIRHGSYEELANIFGLSLQGQVEIFKVRPPSKIDITKIPEAYTWLYSRHFEPHIQVSSNGRYLGIQVYMNPFYAVAINNEFTLDGVIERKKGYQQVNDIENQIKAYRGSDLTQMPFTVFRFDVNQREATPHGLKAEYRQKVEVGRI